MNKEGSCGYLEIGVDAYFLRTPSNAMCAERDHHYCARMQRKRKSPQNVSFHYFLVSRLRVSYFGGKNKPTHRHSRSESLFSPACLFCLVFLSCHIKFKGVSFTYAFSSLLFPVSECIERGPLERECCQAVNSDKFPSGCRANNNNNSCS